MLLSVFVGAPVSASMPLHSKTMSMVWQYISKLSVSAETHVFVYM